MKNIAQNQKKEKIANCKEGVVKFRYDLAEAKLPFELFSELVLWRNKLFSKGLIGAYKDGPMKGMGYGNASIRAEMLGKKGFFITGSQTGHIEKLPAEKYCFIESYNIAENYVKAFGAIAPSSESLTHAAIYETNEKIGAVVHGHSKEIFSSAKNLGLCCTSRKATYGSVELANEIKAIIEKLGRPEKGIIVTLGHKDGVLSWGKDIEEASKILIETLKKAKACQK